MKTFLEFDLPKDEYVDWECYSSGSDGEKTYSSNDESEDNLYKVSENTNSNLNPDISADNMNVVYSSFNQVVHTNHTNHFIGCIDHRKLVNFLFMHFF